MRFFSIIVLILALSSCTPINQKLGLQDDNFGEELVEEAIELKTGLSVDLSPSSKEKK